MSLGSMAMREKGSLKRSAKKGYAFNFTSLLMTVNHLNSSGGHKVSNFTVLLEEESSWPFPLAT